MENSVICSYECFPAQAQTETGLSFAIFYLQLLPVILLSVFSRISCLFAVTFVVFLILCLLSCNFCYLGQCLHVFQCLLNATAVFTLLVVTLLTHLQIVLIHCVWLYNHSVVRYLNTVVGKTILAHLCLVLRQAHTDYILIIALYRHHKALL